jgi:hypothetical protein
MRNRQNTAPSLRLRDRIDRRLAEREIDDAPTVERRQQLAAERASPAR